MQLYIVLDIVEYEFKRSAATHTHRQMQREWKKRSLNFMKLIKRFYLKEEIEWISSRIEEKSKGIPCLYFSSQKEANTTKKRCFETIFFNPVNLCWLLYYSLTLPLPNGVFQWLFFMKIDATLNPAGGGWKGGTILQHLKSAHMNKLQ